ncbi:MAG: undecaprenyl-diphosphate phosphatase, partial [Burkholderiaceae bacterium]
MDITLFLQAVVMGLVEGLTEFLPISSTGHLIVTGSLIGFHDEKAKVFDIAIQTGAIFAVILVYWQRIYDTLRGLTTELRAQRITRNVLIAFFPAVILGLAFGKAIKEHLFNANVVAVALIVGGAIIWWAERRQKTAVRVE